MNHHRFAGTALVAMLTSSLAHSQCNRPEDEKLTASVGADFDSFGRSVAVEGDRALIGAQGASVGQGLVYDFQWDGSSWVEMDQLTSSDGDSGDWFGWRVVIQGDRAVVAAISADGGSGFSGALYAFQWNGTNWTEVQKISASDGESGDNLGWALAMDGDVLVAGAIGDDDVDVSAGAAYVYRWDGSQWNLEQKLVASDGVAADEFGFSAAVSGDVIAVGAVGCDDVGQDGGAVYIYRHDGTDWQEDDKITASDGAAFDWFGWETSLDGDRLATGAVSHDDPEVDGGAVYTYRHDGSDWVDEEKIAPRRIASGDAFGWDVEIIGDRLWTGAIAARGVTRGTGVAFAFHHDGTRWVQIERWFGSDSGGGFGDNFGSAIGTDGVTSLVGAFFGPGSTTDAGAVYRYVHSDLALVADADSATGGDTLTFSTCGGLTGALGMLAVTDFSGTPMFVPIDFGVFDADGDRDTSFTVPSGLAGNTVDVLALGFWRPGTIGLSRAVTIDLQ